MLKLKKKHGFSVSRITQTGKCSNKNANLCPKTGEHLKKNSRLCWAIWRGSHFATYGKMGLLFPIAGLVSLIWFLIRVIPKPSRATYPCQRVAMPLASGFVVWLMGIIGSTLAYRKAKRLFHQSRYLLAGICAAVAVGAIWWSVSLTGDNPAGAAFIPTDPPNTPLGEAKGIHPGRVVWVRQPNATRWDGSTGNWWDDDNTDQRIVEAMVSRAVRTLTGQWNDASAWDALFRHFNKNKGFGNIGYQYGEKIAIKINMNQDDGDSWDWDQGAGMPSPHVIYSVLDQLINMAGVPGSAITVYDASRYIGDPIYNKVRSNPDPHFQSVRFVVRPNEARNGRIAATYDSANPLYTKPGTAYLPRCVTQASYLINMALLRPHSMYGVTLCAKNHFGSVYFPSRSNWVPSPLHDYGRRENPMGSYNCLVNLNGHRHLAGKTLLYIIDGLYPSRNQSPSGGDVIKYLSFGDDWFSSILVSQDPVAIDSVALDFLRNEPRCTEVTGNPDNYLHEAALADNPPSGTFYDPEKDGKRLASLGVHEHWNNPTDRQYSRNLNPATGRGIELVQVSLAPDIDFNDDGKVNFKDFSIFAQFWFQGESPADIAPPLLGDSMVDFNDLAILTTNWLTGTKIPPLPAHASHPNPANGATGIAINVDLSWTAGSGATSHDVYFGRSKPPMFRCNQTNTTFDPGVIAFSTTYYWRVDEVNSWGKTIGTVWKFTTQTGPPPW